MARLLLSALFLLLAAAACREAETPSTTATTETVAATTTVTTTESVATTETQPPPAPTPDPALDPTGSYVAMAKLPAEFAELDHLLLATIDENAAPAPLNGFLRSKKREAQDYTLVNPVIDGRNLTFTTIAVSGVSYAFTGTFTVADHFAANPPAYETAVLTGTLTKLRDGRGIATTPVELRYEAGG